MSGLATGISQAKTQIGLTSLALDNAKKSRQDQVSMQEMGMAKIQSDLIKDYRDNVLNQVYGLLVEAREPITDGNESETDDQDPKEVDPEELKIDLEKQREELKNIAADIKDISDNLKEPEKEEPTPEDPGTDEPSTDNPDKPDDGNNTIPDDTQGDTGNNDNNSDTGTEGQTDGDTQDRDQQEQTVRSRTVMPLMVRQTADKSKRAHLPNRLLHLTQPFNLSSWQMKAELESQEATVARLSLEMKINQETTTFLILQKQKNSSAKRLSE